MKKPIKYIIVACILGISVYNSIYIKKLDEVKQTQSNASFNAKKYASSFMKNEVATLPGIEASEFLKNINNNVKGYSEANGNKLGISNDYYFIIQGKATVVGIEAEDVIIKLTNDDTKTLKIATDFIFGNAIREGAKMANIGDFLNTMDYNNISVEINNFVRETVVPPFVKKVKEGDSIDFKGATQVNIKKPNLENLRVIPLELKIN